MGVTEVRSSSCVYMLLSYCKFLLHIFATFHKLLMFLMGLSLWKYVSYIRIKKYKSSILIQGKNFCSYNSYSLINSMYKQNTLLKLSAHHINIINDKFHILSWFDFLALQQWIFEWVYSCWVIVKESMHSNLFCRIKWKSFFVA